MAAQCAAALQYDESVLEIIICEEIMDVKLLLLRSQDIFSDSRVLKYENFLKEENITCAIVGWDRKGENLKREHTVYYKRRAGFQQGAKGIVNRAWWNFYLLRFLLREYRGYKVIHACDFDTVMPAILMKLLGKKVIFDIFDWFSDEVKTGKFWIDKIINSLEKFAVKHADLVILCEEGRLAQIQCNPKNYIVIPNFPTQLFCEGNEERRLNVMRESDAPIVVTYVGGLVKSRGLVELVDCVEGDERFELEIAGFGDSRIEEHVKNAAQHYQNIHFHGKVSYDKAIELMKKADLLYAMYYKENPNHIFAAPNKFYESVCLRKPIITTVGTLAGEKVEKYKTGFVIEEGQEALTEFLFGINRDIIQTIAQSMTQVNFFKKRLAENLASYRNFIDG